MILVSKDGTLTLTIAAPGTGFAVTLEDHVWLFDCDGNITGSVPPLITAEEIATGTVRHLAVSRPERCPGCAGFLAANYGGGRK